MRDPERRDVTRMEECAQPGFLQPRCIQGVSHSKTMISNVGTYAQPADIGFRKMSAPIVNVPTLHWPSTLQGVDPGIGHMRRCTPHPASAAPVEQVTGDLDTRRRRVY